METKRFYKTQREVAVVLNNLVDSYWADKLDEDIFLEKLLRLYSDNDRKIIKEGKYTTIILQTCGKRRLQVVSKILLVKN